MGLCFSNPKKSLRSLRPPCVTGIYCTGVQEKANSSVLSRSLIYSFWDFLQPPLDCIKFPEPWCCWRMDEFPFHSCPMLCGSFLSSQGHFELGWHHPSVAFICSVPNSITRTLQLSNQSFGPHCGLLPPRHLIPSEVTASVCSRMHSPGHCWQLANCGLHFQRTDSLMGVRFSFSETKHLAS